MDYCFFEGSLGDKIICDLDKTPDLSQRPCGNPVDGHDYSSKPSNDNTNVVNALQESSVVEQDPGKNSSQSPPQINHHCCYECGDPLEDIFCHQCTYELCGRGGHYGYNCLPKVPVVPDPKPFNNQTDRPTICYYDDDDEDYVIAVTPSLLTKEPDNSLSMRDEHLDTIPTTKLEEFIKSSVENLVPIPSESEGIPNSMCDMPFHDNSLPLDVSKDQFEDFFDSNDESTLTDDDSFSIDNIEYVEVSPPNSELVSSEETNTFDNSLLEFEIFCFDLEENSISPADRSDFYEFADELTHIISPPEYDCFFFKNEPNLGDFTMDVVEDIFPTREPRVHIALPTHPTLQLNMDFILSSESLFAYVVWIFLPFLSYSVAPQYLLSLGNEDTIFDPGICSYHISSILPDVSHRSETFIKFNVLNESPMEILFSTCSPWTNEFGVESGSILG
nr:hypothetical protein [Tanacetum cinerariifolium]